MSEKDKELNFGGIVELLWLDTDIKTVKAFLTYLESIQAGMAVLKATETVATRGLGRGARRLYDIARGSKRIADSSQFEQWEINDWIGACLGRGSSAPGHCGFFDPNLKFRDIADMVPDPVPHH